MKTSLTTGLVLIAVVCASAADVLDQAKIDQLTGLKGKFNEKEGVYKVTFPRNDMKVVVDGWTMPPFMGLGTWAAFTPTKNGAMVMGDTVLFEDEVNAAMSAALDNGLSVTALHNHFFFDHPKVYFMHIEGEGGVDQLATAVRKVYDAVRQVRASNAQPKETFGANPLPEKNSISPEPLNKIFGTQGEAKDGMVKFTFGRPATMHGVKIDNTMGVNTWAAFAGSDDNAVVDGDFAVTEDEKDLHRRHSSTHDARTTTNDFFPLLGPRPRKRFGGDGQRRVSHRRFAGSQLAQVTNGIDQVRNL